MSFEDIFRNNVKTQEDLFFFTLSVSILDMKTEIAYLKSKVPEGTPPYSQDVITEEIVLAAMEEAKKEIEKIEKTMDVGGVKN